MLKHLGLVAKEMRGKKRIRRSAIAARIKKESPAIGNFENGKTWQALDELVNAYAEELGIEPTDLWRAALENWEAERRQSLGRDPPPLSE